MNVIDSDRIILILYTDMWGEKRNACRRLIRKSEREGPMGGARRR
jgi:hypothetical protein